MKTDKDSVQRPDGRSSQPPRLIARWVAGVVSVCSAAATALSYFTDKRLAILAFIGMVFAVLLLVSVHRAVRAMAAKKTKFYDVIVKVLTGFVILYFMVLTAALFPSLLRWLRGDKPIETAPPIVGTWKWYPRDQTVTIYPDHTASSTYNVTATWDQIGPQQFQLRWTNGFVDKVTSSEDGKTLTGVNQGVRHPPFYRLY